MFRVGWLGELHPAIAAEWEIGAAVAAFEIDLDAIIEAVPGPVRYEDYTSFPEVRQDLAVVVPAVRRVRRGRRGRAGGRRSAAR